MHNVHKIIVVTDGRVLSTRIASLEHEYIPVVSRNAGRRWAVWGVRHGRRRSGYTLLLPVIIQSK